MEKALLMPPVFSAAWFERHQRTLLWLLAVPVIGRIMRWVLCIRPHDVGYRRRIVQILPHAYIVANGDGTQTLDCRTHAKYGKRIYYAGWPVWWAMHAFDWAIADRWAPALSFGFATLTAYPDAGDPGTATCDGYVRRDGVDEAWATIRAGAGVSAGVTNSVWPFIDMRASATANQWQMLGRSIFTFDTGPLGAGASVSAATVDLYGEGAQTFDNLAVTPNIDIYAATPASDTTLAASDYAQIGTVSQTGSPIAYGSWNGAGYNTFTLSVFTAINAGGITRLGCRNANYDVANVAPAWNNSNRSAVGGYLADQTGTANDPKLVVTYTPYISTLQWGVEAEFSGAGSGWTNISADVRATAPVVCEYGIDGQDPTDRVASTGTLSFALDNSEGNSGSTLGYYSPFSTVKRSGFDFNIGVRFWLWYGPNKVYKHVGKLDVVQPTPGRYGVRTTQCQSVDWMDDAARIDLPSLATATSQRGDQLLTTIIAAMTSTPAASSFDTGASTFTYAFDGATGQKLKVREELIKIAASEQGYIYIQGDSTQGGTLRFEARGARTTSPTTALTFDNDMAREGMGTTGSRSDIFSTVQVIVHPTTIAGSTTELWTLGGAETRIRAGQTLTIDGGFKDANGNACGGSSMVAPVATTDYLLNTAANGSGSNLTGSATVVATYSGQGVSYAITNGSGSDGYVTRAVARGKAVTRTDVTIEKTVAGSYGERTLVIDLPYGTSLNIANNIATYLSTYLSQPVARVKSVKFLASKSATFLAAALATEPGDQVAITEAATGLVSQLFNVQKIRLELQPGGILWCTWQVVPAGLDAWWTPSTVTTSGGTVTTGAGYSLHSFTTPGSYTFTVTGGSATVEYFGIGGGAGSGATGSGSLVGGGSAGEPKEGSTTLAAGSYTIVVGAKGTIGNNGSDSTFLGLTAAGGRRGGAEGQAGASGVLGGGAGNAVFVGTNNGDIGATNDWQSYAAGTGTLYNGGADYVNGAGGGAGAGGVGGDANTNTGGDGGPGLTRSITGSSVTYGTGGNGKGLSTDGTRTAGSYGSGGTSGAGVDGAVFIRVSTEA